MDGERYTLEEIIDAVTQAEDGLVHAIRYRDREGVEDILRDYLRHGDG